MGNKKFGKKKFNTYRNANACITHYKKKPYLVS